MDAKGPFSRHSKRQRDIVEEMLRDGTVDETVMKSLAHQPDPNGREAINIADREIRDLVVKVMKEGTEVSVGRRRGR